MCNFSGMIKNALPSLRQGGPARKGSAADKKASAAALPVTPSRKPRTCGEKQLLIARHFDDARITPACAGKSGLAAAQKLLNQDHPRMCGEKVKRGYRGETPVGSPPHVRGKVDKNVANKIQERITPACAGKSFMWMKFCPVTQDHPRMCGEKCFRCGCTRPALGSPPHVRGKALISLKDTKQARITPACAGKRLKRSRSIVPHAAIVPLFPSVCNKPAGSDGSPAGHDAPPFLPIENAAPASPAYNLRSL